MDSIGARTREVEKPKTRTEARTALISRLTYRALKLRAQSKAVLECFAPRTPMVEWLAEAAEDIEAAAAELERTRR